MSVIEERVRNLRAYVSEHVLDVSEPFVLGVICNECGFAVGVSNFDDTEKAERVFEDWRLDPDPPYHDLCPECAC